MLIMSSSVETPFFLPFLFLSLVFRELCSLSIKLFYVHSCNFVFFVFLFNHNVMQAYRWLRAFFWCSEQNHIVTSILGFFLSLYCSLLFYLLFDILYRLLNGQANSGRISIQYQFFCRVNFDFLISCIKNVHL